MIKSEFDNKVGAYAAELVDDVLNAKKIEFAARPDLMMEFLFRSVLIQAVSARIMILELMERQGYFEPTDESADGKPELIN